MALHWQIKDDNPAWKALDDSVRELLIFGLIIADMGEVKDEKAAQKFFTRLRMMERAQGDTFIHKDGAEVPITLADCRAAIGLSGNVVTESDAFFNRKVAKVAREDALTELRHQLEKEKNAIS